MKHKKRYDPKAETYRYQGRFGAGDDIGDIEVPYNPTEVHLDRAREKKDHARQHLAAAQTLERFEAASCRQFSKDKRVVCPLIGQVQRVQNTPKGVRLHLAKGAPVKAVLAHMKCHYAYGRVVVRKGMDKCPLYLKDLTIRASQDYRFVEITSKDAKTVGEIQRRAKLHVSP